jgi:predicted  nucleic acid-binding Zn-ribbon protein
VIERLTENFGDSIQPPAISTTAGSSTRPRSRFSIFAATPPAAGPDEGGRISSFAGPSRSQASTAHRARAQPGSTTKDSPMRLSIALRRGALAAALIAAAGSTAWAQNAARPAEGKTLSIGGGTGSGPLLTREELRACFQREESVRTRIAALEAAREPLEREKAEIVAEQEALRAARAPIDERRRLADELGARMKAYGERVADWNARVKEFNEADRRGVQADRMRVQLNKEREDLEKERQALDAEKAQLSSGTEEMIRAFNARAAALETRIASWNERNGKWNEDSSLAEAERKDWISSCANRRYREEDELAIKRGR